MAKTPEFTAGAFTPTKWSTAADKARFANHYVRFVEGGFADTSFPKWFYTRLSMCFGHISHYDRDGFYATWFTTKRDQLTFLRQALYHPGYEDPAYTYSDVEDALRNWIMESGIPQRLEREIAQETEAAERATLARLAAKYS